MLRKGIILIFTGLLTSGLFTAGAAMATEKQRAASGRTQVIASINGQEITIHQLRIEMSRLNLDVTDPTSEAKALRSLTDRILIAEAAREAGLHKKPEAMWRMEAARELALAETYMGIVSQPPEPTQDRVERFILDNPTLFTGARRYTFSVIELSNDDTDLEAMTPLFDETPDFEELKAWMDEKSIAYTQTVAVKDSSAFPKPVRQQLADYALEDNLVLKGNISTTIMKIIRIENTSLSVIEALPLARVMLKQEDTTGRVRDTLEKLRAESRVKIYRDSARPVSEQESR